MKNFIVKSLVLKQIAVSFIMCQEGKKYDNINDFIKDYYFTLNNNKDKVNKLVKEIR